MVRHAEGREPRWLDEMQTGWFGCGGRWGTYFAASDVVPTPGDLALAGLDERLDTIPRDVVVQISQQLFGQANLDVVVPLVVDVGHGVESVLKACDHPRRLPRAVAFSPVSSLPSL